MQQVLRLSLLMPLLYYVSRSLIRREGMMYKKGNRVCRMAYHTSWIYKRCQKYGEVPAGHWSGSVPPIGRWRYPPIRMESSLPGIVRQLPLCISHRQMPELSYRKYCCVHRIWIRTIRHPLCTPCCHRCVLYVRHYPCCRCHSSTTVHSALSW